MENDCTSIPLQQTGYFSKIVCDYLNNNSNLFPFYEHSCTINGIKNAIENRAKYHTNRTALVKGLQQQYHSIQLNSLQQQNLNSLSNDNTYTVTTAHQPNIFTGPLYFIYKIIQTIKLSHELKQQFPENNFVPIYFMGSEDADIEELGQININNHKFRWLNNQTGAVGRMLVDEHLLNLISEINKQVTDYQYGNEIINLFKKSYILHHSIQSCTLNLVNALFKEFGLLVLIPDNRIFKTELIGILEKEIDTQLTFNELQVTNNKLEQLGYPVQVTGRKINLFYLIDNNRERIEKQEDTYIVRSLNLKFTKEEIKQEIKLYPERFSPNVITRAVFQELLLPNVACIGGGGELAYWLQFKSIFKAFNIPFPVLIVRNSFVFLNDRARYLMQQLKFYTNDLIKPIHQLEQIYVDKHSSHQLSIESELKQILTVYQSLQQKLSSIDITLLQHTISLQQQAENKLKILQKKIYKSEKRKFYKELQQLSELKEIIFPNNQLQERVENFSIIYAIMGAELINIIYRSCNNTQSKLIIV